MPKKDEEIVFTPKTEFIYKVIVIGDPSVGKTSLLNKYTQKKFATEYIPTVGTNILKEIVEIEDNNKKIQINLMLWDIAGQKIQEIPNFAHPQFYMLHKPYFNGADGMILMFDITRSSSFTNCKNWYSTAMKFGLSHVPRILIGNKIDLKDERKIILPMASHLSEELNAPYFETSALTGDGVSIIFRKISEMVYHSRKEE